jgi:hypothetical protein
VGTACGVQWRRGCSEPSVGLKEVVLQELINCWKPIHDFLVIHPSYCNEMFQLQRETREEYGILIGRWLLLNDRLRKEMAGRL